MNIFLHCHTKSGGIAANVKELPEEAKPEAVRAAKYEILLSMVEFMNEQDEDIVKLEFQEK